MRSWQQAGRLGRLLMNHVLHASQKEHLSDASVNKCYLYMTTIITDGLLNFRRFVCDFCPGPMVIRS